MRKYRHSVEYAYLFSSGTTYCCSLGATFSGTEYSLVGYPLSTINEHKMSEMVC